MGNCSKFHSTFFRRKGIPKGISSPDNSLNENTRKALGVRLSPKSNVPSFPRKRESRGVDMKVSCLDSCLRRNDESGMTFSGGSQKVVFNRKIDPNPLPARRNTVFASYSITKISYISRLFSVSRAIPFSNVNLQAVPEGCRVI